MKRKNSKYHKSPLIRLVGLEAATVAAAAGMTCSPATAAPGDLDPSFGDVGRQSSIHQSMFPQWSVDVQADDAVLLGGGGEYCYFGCYEDYFVGRLLPNGTPDASFSAAALTDTWVLDTALQPDGKVVGVGNSNSKLQVFRLRSDGSLDADFGVGGLVQISAGSGATGHSVIIDPDGRIVVAGTRFQSGVQGLILVRLQPNGALDASFGTGGTFVPPGISIGAGGYPARIARAVGGGYRVMAHPESVPGGQNCSVYGITDTGLLDAAFGTAGVAAAPSSNAGTANGAVLCASLAVQPDGRLLLGGRRANVDEAYFSRLLANGATDPSIATVAAPAQVGSVTSLAVGSSGSIFVGGTDRTGLSGAIVVRMLADGALDTLFGHAGVAKVDLNARRAAVPFISDMKVTTNDALVIAGNSYGSGYSGDVFVARLLGNVAGGSPGVLSISQRRVLGTEQGAQAVLTVRRTGGSQGAVAVTYATRDFPAPPTAGSEHAPGDRATSGADYTTTTGRLAWADGDFSDREIVVPIASDTNAELPEFFEVVLESPEGGAGLGVVGSDVEIAGASYPAGDLTIRASEAGRTEGGVASFWIDRNYYSQGAISVTVRVAAGGSALPGQDFSRSGSSDWQDVVLTWGDGELGSKELTVSIARDDISEPTETFALELVAPTGGAVLGSKSQVMVSVFDLPPSGGGVSSGGSGGGGGSFGWLGAMLLGLGGALRRRRIRNR
jgi:uncharacterized delta-60 repeat protein/MYXO-CTERM domain-containing protein